MNLNMTKRILSFVLTLALLMGNFPAVAFATEEEIPAPAEVVEEETVAPTEVVTEETAAATGVPAVAETVAPTETATEPAAETVPAEDLAVAAASDVIKSGTCGENLTWVLDQDGVLTISGTGAMKNYPAVGTPWDTYCDSIKTVVIEDGVTSIGNRAFCQCDNLTSVNIPDSVTSIGNRAFYGCDNLTSVNIPDSVTSIGDSAFSDCRRLPSIKIPNGVTSISDLTFAFCGSLISIELPDSVTSIGNRAFDGCYNLTSVNIPDSVTSIGDGAFNACANLTSVNIPDSVTSIGDSLFYHCTGLTSIEIPDSVTSIGNDAFHGCRALTSIKMSDRVTSIGDSAFYYCTGLTSIEIPDRVTSIGDYAFYYCPSLTSIEIPGSVTSIGDCAFLDCSSMKGIWVSSDNTVYCSDETGVLFSKDMSKLIYAPVEAVGKAYEIPNGVTSIGDYAFYNCTGLTSIEIPDRVTSIGDYAFYYCPSLTSIEIPGSVTSIGDYAFYECSSLTSIEIPGSVTSIGDFVFYYCSSLTSIEIPDSVTSIGDFAFAACERLPSIKIPNGVTSIGERAFSGCSGLTSIKIPDSVTSIGDSAFQGCSKVTHIKIPDGVTSIGEWVFYECSKLTSIEIPDSVTSIGESSFYRCRSLAGIDIPNSVTSIGNFAFFECRSLKHIVIPDSVTSISWGAFNGCTGLISIDLPNGITSIEGNILGGCSKLTSIEIPDSVTSIGNYAFNNCSSLKSIEIPGRVTSIGEEAFRQCSGLTSIEIPDSVTSIGAFAFANCLRVTSVYISDGVASIGDGAFYKSFALDEITFTGDAPDIGDSVFEAVRATAYYPAGNSTWTADVMQNYGGKITWVEKCTNHTVETLPAIDPTCTESGLTEGSRCTSCQELIVPQQTVPALGHDMAPWEISKEVACTEHGEKRRDCSRCDYFETQQIIMPGHTEAIDEGVAATCTEDGITEGRHCAVCAEVLLQQQVIPAMGHDYVMQDGDAVCTACEKTLHARFAQSHVMLNLLMPNPVQLDLEISPSELAETARWSIEGEEGIISIDQNGCITPLSAGTVYVVVTVADGAYEISTRCRIDVTEELQIAGIQLSKTAVTTELYSTDYAKFEILLQLPQNNQFAAIDAETTAEYLGIAIESARFEDENLAELFEIRVLDDRNVEIIPTDYAVNNPKSVSGKYTGKVIVTVQGEEFASETLTLTVKKTLPKLKATVAEFNSFYSGQSQQITVTGGTVTAVREDASKGNAIPNWLNLSEDGILTLNEQAPLKSVSAKAYILVDTEEWRIPAAVTLSIKNTYKGRGLKLSASAVTFTTDSANSNGVKLNLLSTEKNKTLADLKVTDITAPAGYIVEDFNIADGSFVLKTESGFKAGAINLGVTFEDTETAQPVKLTVKTAKITLKASATKVTLNITRNDSAVIDITATPADYQITDPVITLTGTELVNKKKVTVDKLNSGELDIGFEEGKLRIATTSKTPDKASYKLTINAGGSKAVTITINTVSTVPSVTFKATGSMDLSFPNQVATIMPTFKNCGNSFDSFEYSVAEMKGKTVVNENVSNAFEVVRDGNVLKIRSIDETINTSNTYAFKLKLILEDGSSIENTVSLKVKRTAVKLKLSATKLTLNKLIGDKAAIDVTCTTKGYNFTEPSIELKDSKNNSAAGQLDISYNNGKLNIATNDATAYGASYKVLVKSNTYAPATTLSVTIPKADKSTVTATVKASGSIDVIRDGSGITVTPNYKNCYDSKAVREELFIYSSEDGYTRTVNHLFNITPNSKGGYLITKAEGAALIHGPKYKVKVVATFSNTETESALTSMTVTMGAAKLTLKAEDTMLFAQDKYDRVVFRFESTDKALNGATKVEIKDAKYQDMFEILDYGNGEFAIGFKDETVSGKLIGKKASLDVTLNLNVFIDGNQTTKANTTAKIKLTIVK